MNDIKPFRSLYIKILEQENDQLRNENEKHKNDKKFMCDSLNKLNKKYIQSINEIEHLKKENDRFNKQYIEDSKEIIGKNKQIEQLKEIIKEIFKNKLNCEIIYYYKNISNYK